MRNYNEETWEALRGGAPTCVPFTVYRGMVPVGSVERKLRGRGLAICHRVTPFRSHMPDVRIARREERDGDVVRTRTVYETPVGTVSELMQPAAYGSMRRVEHRVKTLDDYAVAEFMARNTVYEPAYDELREAQEQMGTDGYVLGSTCYSPLMEIEVSLLGIERFCMEIIDHEAEVMSLYEVLMRKQREMFRIVAKSPAQVCLYGGNIMPKTLGPARIERFICPCWQEFAGLMHEEGKMLGVHLDANNQLLLDLVARSELDMIEAFTPPPDCDTGVAEARAAWPGKVLSLNFPSSVHLRRPHEIREVTRRLIEEAGDRRGFIIGITENVPLEAVPASFSAILDAIESCPLA